MNVPLSVSSSVPTDGAPPRKRLIFAGGGSGGHIFPGLAIAGEVQRLSLPGVCPEILFVISDRAIDAKIMSGEPWPADVSPAKPLLKSIMGVIRFARGWQDAHAHARRVLGANGAAGASSTHVVALGGFVAGPFVSTAKRLRVPITMVNLDAVPGKANRYIAQRADRIFTAARVPREHRTRMIWTEVPPIVRKNAKASSSRDACRAQLGLDPHRPVLMVTGGSQGLRSLNSFVTAFAATEAGQRALKCGPWQILHQTGRNLDETVRNAYRAAGIESLVVPFTEQMGTWWGAADLAVCTAGAGNVAEIWMNQTPALLLPYPYHKDEHQKFNAAPVQEVGGAVVGKDMIEPDANVRQNGEALARLLTDAPTRESMREKLATLGPADGATRIARALLDALGGHHAPG